jgi:hypothetical protein
VFDETNGSQVEQVDLDELDDEEAPCVTLRNMSIGVVCPKESEETTQAQDQPSSSIQASPPTQDEDQTQNDEDEDQKDESPQEEDIDQGEDDPILLPFPGSRWLFIATTLTPKKSSTQCFISVLVNPDSTLKVY